MSRKLIAFDLDGTLLDDEKRIPPENLRALEAAAERGWVPVPATGRIVRGIPEPVKRLPGVRYLGSTTPRRIGCSTGATCPWSWPCAAMSIWTRCP